MDELGIPLAAAAERRPVFFRPVRHDDLEPLLVIDRLVFGALAYPSFVLRQFIDVHHRSFLVADAGRELFGYALAAQAANAAQAWLLGLGVRPDMREHGYGRALLERCLAGLRRDGADQVSLTVEPGNLPAIRLYESTGFRIQELERDYYGPGEHRYLMSACVDRRPTGHNLRET